MDDRFEVIDAFVDGERVDAAALKRALAEADGRDYFVDTWLLREGVQDELAVEPVPQGDVPALEASAPPTRAAVTAPSNRRGTWRAAVAASLVGLIGGGLGGYLIAERSLASRVSAPTVADAPSAPSAPTASFPAPTPTRAIPIEFSTHNAASGGGD